MKDKCMQLREIANEICGQNDEVTAVLMISGGGHQFAYVHGKEIEIAVNLAYMMHQVGGFDNAVKMAVDAYDNVPLKES